MDQGVFKYFKRSYRKKLVLDILRKIEFEGNGLVDALKSVNIKDVIYVVAKYFEAIPSSTFVKSWRKAWPGIQCVYSVYNG